MVTDNRVKGVHFESCLNYNGKEEWFNGTQLNLWNYELTIPDVDVSNDVSLEITIGVEIQEGDNTDTYDIIADTIRYEFYNGTYTGESN